ncbi:hypothetical protein Tcan_01925 [Toxocara canis]|uniref:Uncharacterized protein n=1 Tax=Toxocara canis TaxID=6265 RepID=A0A0B2VZE9_TOXCA|nr:hypothetical protein Tcan_01925 [Toxocara canis]
MPRVHRRVAVLLREGSSEFSYGSTSYALQTFGEDSESDSKSSLSPISSPIILEMLELELERQKRKRREESIESNEDDSRV